MAFFSGGGWGGGGNLNYKIKTCDFSDKIFLRFLLPGKVIKIVKSGAMATLWCVRY